MDLERLEEKVELAKKAICDIGFHFGTNGKNIEEFGFNKKKYTKNNLCDGMWW